MAAARMRTCRRSNACPTDWESKHHALPGAGSAWRASLPIGQRDHVCSNAALLAGHHGTMPMSMAAAPDPYSMQHSMTRDPACRPSLWTRLWHNHHVAIAVRMAAVLATLTPGLTATPPKHREVLPATALTPPQVIRSAPWDESAERPMPSGRSGSSD